MRTARRGFTLLELTIVIAVTAVMTAGIVTLCAAVKGLSERTQATQMSLTDVSTVRREASRWLSFFDTPEWEITVGNNDASDNTPDGTEPSDTVSTRLVATKAGDSKTFYKLRMTYADGKCTFVAEYPDSDDGTSQNFTAEMSGTTLLHFDEVDTGGIEVPMNNADDKESVIVEMPDGAMLVKCTVGYFESDAKGNLLRRSAEFLLVARGRAQ